MRPGYQDERPAPRRPGGTPRPVCRPPTPRGMLLRMSLAIGWNPIQTRVWPASAVFERERLDPPRRLAGREGFGRIVLRRTALAIVEGRAGRPWQFGMRPGGEAVRRGAVPQGRRGNVSRRSVRWHGWPDLGSTRRRNTTMNLNHCNPSTCVNPHGFQAGRRVAVTPAAVGIETFAFAASESESVAETPAAVGIETDQHGCCQTCPSVVAVTPAAVGIETACHSPSRTRSRLQ